MKEEGMRMEILEMKDQLRDRDRALDQKTDDNFNLKGNIQELKTGNQILQ